MVDFDFDRMVVELVVGHMEVDLIVDLLRHRWLAYWLLIRRLV